MTEADIEIILERAKERYPGVRPRVISDNGPAVYREGLQGVYSALGHDARQDFTVLPSIERQNRTLAQIPQRGVHSARDAAVARRSASSGGGLRRALQQRAFEQRHRLHHAKGHARRASAGDSGRAGSEVGRGEGTAEESPPAGRVTDGTDYFRFADYTPT